MADLADSSSQINFEDMTTVGNVFLFLKEVQEALAKHRPSQRPIRAGRLQPGKALQLLPHLYPALTVRRLQSACLVRRSRARWGFSRR
jgi:hypothetical protein